MLLPEGKLTFRVSLQRAPVYTFLMPDDTHSSAEIETLIEGSFRGVFTLEMENRKERKKRPMRGKQKPLTYLESKAPLAPLTCVLLVLPLQMPLVLFLSCLFALCLRLKEMLFQTYTKETSA
jgi:hypothetical protein